MEFLDAVVGTNKVYAGFWKRFCAGIIDMFVFLPFLYLFYLLESISISTALVSAIISSILFVSYSIFFHYKFGATLGKMAAGVKVTLPDGSPIGLKQALLRSSVDVAFSIFAVIAQIIAINSSEPDKFLSLGWGDRAHYLFALYPAWYFFVNVSSQIWYWGELIVLLFNKRKRALHDFIAGTVVIKKEYVE